MLDRRRGEIRSPEGREKTPDKRAEYVTSGEESGYGPPCRLNGLGGGDSRDPYPGIAGEIVRSTLT